MEIGSKIEVDGVEWLVTDRWFTDPAGGREPWDEDGMAGDETWARIRITDGSKERVVNGWGWLRLQGET